MNKTKIEWCDTTWNPVTGCYHGCEYCYARRISARFGGYDNSDGTITTHNPIPSAELSQPLTITRKNGKTIDSPFPFGFEPTFHRYRLEEPQRMKRPQNIFVCSMADLFGNWVPTRWIVEVMDACQAAPQHRYLFLTKNPERYAELAIDGKLPFSSNFWYGATATNADQMNRASEAFGYLPASSKAFLSIEPLMEDITKADGWLSSMIQATTPYFGWIILGALTGPSSAWQQPKRELAESIVKAANNAEIPVFMKDSLIPIVGEENMRREFPWDAEA